MSSGSILHLAFFALEGTVEHQPTVEHSSQVASSSAGLVSEFSVEFCSSPRFPCHSLSGGGVGQHWVES